MKGLAMLRPLACIALLAFSAPLLAQAPSEGQKPRAERFDCSKAKDPKACEERLARAKAAHEKARKACEGKKGEEGRDCMRREMCAQAKDPAKCEAQVKEAAARRAQIREACKGKQGEELKSCVREQRQKK
jgi:Spy/CpxP family protein refolding chaperone